MQRLIDDANEWGKANGKASDLSIESFSDVVTAIDYIQQKQKIAGTTAAEAGRTISGSIGAAKSAWSNLLTEFGKADGDIAGAMDALVTSIVGDGTDSNLGVIGNVVPRIGIIIKNAVEQIPGLVRAVAPRIGSAFLEAFDSATNGLGTQVLEFLAPVTDAIGSTIGSIGEWFAQNQGAIDSVVGALGNFASVIVDGVAGAIEFLSPIIGDLASGALPILSAAFSAAAGFAQGLGNMFSNLLDAISPITSALAPIVDAIGTALVNALKWAGDAMSNADFSGFASIVKDALGGVVDFIGDTINNLTGFFDAVAQFLDDPIGSIQRGFDSLVSGSKKAESGVATNFRGIEKDVDRSLDGAGRSVDDYNNKSLDSKSSSATVNGNAVDGTAITAVGNTNRAVGSMTGNNVTVTATGNATDGSAAANIWNTVAAVAALASSTGNFSVGGGGGYSGSSGGAFAEGGIRYHADGMILNRATWIGGRDIAGENGAEAIIPLTNKQYTRPFADTLAEQMLSRMSGTTVNINNAQVNADAEIQRCTYDLLVALKRKGQM